MTDTPNLSQAYAVVATFGLPPNAKIYQNALIAPSKEAAAAMVVYGICKANPELPEITGVAVMELTPEWMRSALQGGQPAKVFSVVPAYSQPDASYPPNDVRRWSPDQLANRPMPDWPAPGKTTDDPA